MRPKFKWFLKRIEGELWPQHQSGDWQRGKPRSYGVFQIQPKLHGITVADATDPYYAADYANSVKLISIKYK